MSNSLSNIGFIGGLVTKVYNASEVYITIFQNTEGRLCYILVDDGLELREYEYAKPDSKVRKQKFPGVLSSGFKS